MTEMLGTSETLASADLRVTLLCHRLFRLEQYAGCIWL